MDTNSNISLRKTVVSVEILHLDEMGYGPGGGMTRRDWRALCLKQLLAGSKIFKDWQASWLHTEQSEDKVKFHYKVSNDDESAVTAFSLLMHRCSYDFIGIQFDKTLYVNGYLFLKTADFSYSSFGVAFFKNTSFAQVSFEYSIFKGHTNFGMSHFRGKTTFRRAVFMGDVHFEGVLFKGNAYFIQTEFQKHCQFCNQYDSEKKIWGQETRFSQEVDFENAIFKSVCHFERVHFLGKTPSFLGVDNASTRIEFSGDEYFNKNDISEDAIKRLGQLKRLADEQGQTDQALSFNALELHAKASMPNAHWFFKFFTYLYDVVSDYGRSFMQPLGIYASILMLTFLVALEHSAYNAPRNYTQQGCEKYIWWVERVSWIEDKNCVDKTNLLQLTGLRAASEYTLYRAAGVLDFSDNGKATDAVANRLFGQSIEPWWMRIWGVFKAIASTALLFLAALGLRNKYRIK